MGKRGNIFLRFRPDPNGEKRALSVLFSRSRRFSTLLLDYMEVISVRPSPDPRMQISTFSPHGVFNDDNIVWVILAYDIARSRAASACVVPEIDRIVEILI